MRIQSGIDVFSAGKILTFALAVSALLGGLRAAAGQGASPPPGVEFYGGVEVTDEDARAIALNVSKSEEGPGFKLVYSEVIRLNLGRMGNGEFAPRASEDAADKIQKLLARLRQQYRVPPDHLYLIGASRLGADHPKDLTDTLRTATGLTVNFLDVATEVQLSIAGAIPRIGKAGGASIDNRNTSVLMDIGAAGTQGGYELLRYSPADAPSVDFVALSFPQGALSYANEIGRKVGENREMSAFMQQVKVSGAMPFRQALRKELESKPGMVHRKRVYLTGSIVWAMVTLLYPEDRQAFVPLAYESFAEFADKSARSTKELINPNTSLVRDRKLRQEFEQDLETLRGAFTPKELAAGAELLKAAADELKWQEKSVWFARLGHLGCILSYVRLQTGK
jgi:hypothetical protein